MKKILLFAFVLTIAFACSNSEKKENADQSTTTSSTPETPKVAADDQGIGKFRDLTIDPKLDPAKAEKGKAIFDVKCSACHKLNNEKLVGPGWKGVTTRYRAEWIMNFATNVDEMLNKDPKAQAQLEVCLVRMPNQNLSDNDARNVYEFMRQNDGVK